MLLMFGGACEANSQRLDPPILTDGGAPIDADLAADAEPEREDVGRADVGADADSGPPDIGPDSGLRLFRGRIGLLPGGDPSAFQPTDLSGWTLRARSDLGASTPIIDGPGRFSVPAAGRLELTAVPPDSGDMRYLVSTEAAGVDLVWSTSPSWDADRARRRLQLDVELAEPWSADDVLTVSSSGLWAARLSPPRSSVGMTRLTGLVASNDHGGRLVGEDLWVVRSRARVTATSTASSVIESALIRRASAASLERPLSVRLERVVSPAPATRWDLTAWQDDGVSEYRGTSARRTIVRADRAWASGPLRGCGGLGSSDAWVLGSESSGELPESAPTPDGYITCSSAAGIASTPLEPVRGVKFMASEACSCGERATQIRLDLGPVRALRLDGRPLGAFETVYRAPFTLSWQPPDLGVARGYVVNLVWFPLGATLVTDTTQVTLPADFIPVGVPINPTFVAIDDADRAPVESPFVRSLRWQSTEWASGTLRPAP